MMPKDHMSAEQVTLTDSSQFTAALSSSGALYSIVWVTGALSPAVCVCVCVVGGGAAQGVLYSMLWVTGFSHLSPAKPPPPKL